MASAEAWTSAPCVVRYPKGRSRDLPLLVAGLPIFSKAYYASRPFDEATLEPPLGSGPYGSARFEQGRFIDFERVPDYWAARPARERGARTTSTGCATSISATGRWRWKGFKAGAITFREEFTSRDWATALRRFRP